MATLNDIRAIIDDDQLLTDTVREGLLYRATQVVDEWIDNNELTDDDISPEQWAMIWSPWVIESMDADYDDDEHPVDEWTTGYNELSTGSTLKQLLYAAKDAADTVDCADIVNDTLTRNDIDIDAIDEIDDDTRDMLITQAVQPFERQYLIEVVFEPTYIEQ